MNKLYFLIVAAFLFGCNNKQKQQNSLPGDFRYTSYRLVNTKDSFGISVNHYLQIYKDGNYRLVMRKNSGEAAYYYGFIGYNNFPLINEFVADTALLLTDTLTVSDSINRYKFDYNTGTGQKKIAFTSSTESEQVKTIQQKLDSIIASPGKKLSSHFNIDGYLKNIITEDSSAIRK